MWVLSPSPFLSVPLLAPPPCRNDQKIEFNQNQDCWYGAGYCRVGSLCVKASCGPFASFLHEEPVFLAQPHSSLCSLAWIKMLALAHKVPRAKPQREGSSHTPSEQKAFPLVQPWGMLGIPEATQVLLENSAQAGKFPQICSFLGCWPQYLPWLFHWRIPSFEMRSTRSHAPAVVLGAGCGGGVSTWPCSGWPSVAPCDGRGPTQPEGLVRAWAFSFNTYYSPSEVMLWIKRFLTLNNFNDMNPNT